MKNIKKGNKAKTVLYVILGLGLVGALAGTGVALSRINKDHTPPTSDTSRPDDENPSENQGSSSDNNSSSDSEEQENSSSNSDHQENNEQVSISCSAGEVYWTSTVQQGEMHELSFVATLTGLPSTATNEDKGLYIYCDDEELDDWIQIYRVSNGQEVTMYSPYHFQSGEVIHLRQKKLASEHTAFYKIPLWIFADNYDNDQVYSIIDVWFRTNA